MQIPVRKMAGWLTALVVVGVGCSVDTAGLQAQDDAAGGSGGGIAGSGGIRGTAGVPGSAGAFPGVAGAGGMTSGVAGAQPSGIAGAAGKEGVAGAGGAANASGAAGDQGPGGGPGGVSGDSGSAGADAGGHGGTGTTGGGAGTGTIGEAGTSGGAGAGGSGGDAGSAGGRGGFTGFGGRGGFTGRGGTGGSSACAPASCGPCFRCGATGCEPAPEAAWKLICDSATIAPTRPSGIVWDPNSAGPGNGPLPDVFCQLAVDSRMKSSSIDGDSLMPKWNADVTPTTGGGLTASVLMSSDWKLSVIDQDNATSSSETICTVNNLSAADLTRGSVTFTEVESCVQLVLKLQCAAGKSP